MGIKSDAFVTEKLASSRSPGDSAKATSDISGKEVRANIQQHRREYEEGRKGTTGSEFNTFVANPKKLELNLTGSGISKKAADIINSIRQSSYTSSKSEPAEGSGKPSRFDNCKDFLRRSNAQIPFDASSTSKPIKSFPASKSIPNLGTVLVENKGSLTEVHSGTHTKNNCSSVSVGAGEDTLNPGVEDEVEIVSLLEEQIPRYKLRADTLTKFSGYANEDFVGIPFPALQDFSPVTPEQAYLTLGYFLLCGERVSQMTKTFADTDALQKLLEEKERDVELAARIGQQLLEQNQVLNERVATLEAENRDNIECITQLKHELNFKAQLLELYNDSTESAENSTAATPVGTVATVLEHRLQSLEEENKALRQDASHLAEDLEKTEAQEKYLVEDAISRLNESNERLYKLSDEVERKTEEVKSQQEEIIVLEKELKTLKSVNGELLGENIELRKVVEVLTVSQNELGTEIIDLKDNYVEVVAILKETQEQLREAQKKKEEGADVITVFDSLAYEIDSSVARQRKSSDYFRRTFDTVRCANSKIADPSLASSALVSCGSVSGFGSSGLPSLDSSSSHDLVNSNFNSLIMESGLGSLCHSPGGSSTPGSAWRLPEKLQIVKPLEGSSTLQIWSNLATPHLGNLLDKRPGVQTRVERSIEGINPNTILSLASEANTVIVSTPAVFTFVTTSSSRNSNTILSSSNTMSSTQSTGSLFSLQSTFDHSSSPILTPTSRDKEQLRSEAGSSLSPSSSHAAGDYLKLCETPQNSPLDGNSRPMSPTSFKPGASGSGDQVAKASSSRTLKTLFAVYDTLCSKLGDRRNPSPCTSQKYDVRTKLGSVEVSFESSRLQAPPKPGTGALQKILLEPD